MDMTTNRRYVTFVPEVKETLVRLVEKSPNVIESKESYTSVLTNNENTVKKIEQLTVALSDPNLSRHIKFFETNSSNIKKKSKRKFPINRTSLLKTAGELFSSVRTIKTDNTVKASIGQQTNGLNNKHDIDSVRTVQYVLSDGDISDNLNTDVTTVQSCSEDEFQELPDNNTENNFAVVNHENEENVTHNQQHTANVSSNGQKEIVDCSGYLGPILTRPVSSKLRVNESIKPSIFSKKIIKEKAITTKRYRLNHQLIKEKIDFVKLLKEKFEEEHILKVHLLQKKIEFIEKLVEK